MENDQLSDAILGLADLERDALIARVIAQEVRAGRTKACFKALLGHLSSNREAVMLLIEVADAVLEPKNTVYKRNKKRWQWFTSHFEKDMSIKPLDAAKEYMRVTGASGQSVHFLGKVARQAKNTLIKKDFYHSQKAGIVRKYRTDSIPPIGNPGDVTKKIVPKTVRVRAGDPLAVSRLPVTELDRIIAPFRDDISRLASPDVIDRMVRALGDNRNVPSLYTGPGKSYDTETVNAAAFPEIMEVLKQISLFDHTCHVLTHAIRLTHETQGREAYMMIPQTITAALMHDIGKIPEYRLSGRHRYGHYGLSRDYVESYFGGNVPYWAKKVAQAVAAHHHGPKEKGEILTGIIMEADARARVEEILSGGAAIKASPLQEWLDLSQLASTIEPSVNIISNRRWQAVSHKGNVYCMYGFLLDCLMRLSREKRVIDFRLVRRARPDAESILTDLVNILRDRKCLGLEIPWGHYCRKFMVSINKETIPDHAFKLVPIRLDMFSVSSRDLDRRKTDYLKLVGAVYPVDRSGS